jgi:CubicO group peptidase (beta-lactamase class C family)
MHISFGNKLLAAIVLPVLLSSCSTVNSSEEPVSEYQVPIATGDGLQVASVGDVGMKQEPLESMMARLKTTTDHRVHSVLVVKNQKLVFEKYYSGRKFNLGQYTGGTGYDINDLHVLCSATKSIASALLGIAIDKGYIKSVDQKVYEFFPEHDDLFNSSPRKRAMTIRHLLTMMSGLEWDDESLPYTDHRNDMHLMFEAADPIRFVLAKPLVADPGTVFDYDNGNTNVIGEIIHRASNQRLDQFAKDHLFDKLGITQMEWQMLKNNVVLCSGDLHLRPRDMAKIGLLFLNKGAWNGEQIISKSWCEISSASSLNPNQYNHEFPWAQGYGFQWWQKTYTVQGRSYSSFFASGWGGQYIIVFPDLNAVVVMTGGNWYDPETIPFFNIISEYMLPSLIP